MKFSTFNGFCFNIAFFFHHLKSTRILQQKSKFSWNFNKKIWTTKSTHFFFFTSIANKYTTFVHSTVSFAFKPLPLIAFSIAHFRVHFAGDTFLDSFYIFFCFSFVVWLYIRRFPFPALFLLLEPSLFFHLLSPTQVFANSFFFLRSNVNLWFSLSKVLLCCSALKHFLLVKQSNYQIYLELVSNYILLANNFSHFLFHLISLTLSAIFFPEPITSWFELSIHVNCFSTLYFSFRHFVRKFHSSAYLLQPSNNKKLSNNQNQQNFGLGCC